MYEWRQEYIESVERNGYDVNGNPRYVVYLESGGYTKRLTIAGRFSNTNGLHIRDKGWAWVYMNWDTNRAKYIMFLNPAEFGYFYRATMNHVRKAMEERNVPLVANAMDALKASLDAMQESFPRHRSVDDAFWELYSLVGSSEESGRMHSNKDEAMRETITALEDYLLDMNLWWHDRLSEDQVKSLVTFRSGLLDHRTQGFDWAN